MFGKKKSDKIDTRIVIAGGIVLVSAIIVLVIAYLYFSRKKANEDSLNQTKSDIANKRKTLKDRKTLLNEMKSLVATDLGKVETQEKKLTSKISKAEKELEEKESLLKTQESKLKATVSKLQSELSDKDKEMSSLREKLSQIIKEISDSKQKSADEAKEKSDGNKSEPIDDAVEKGQSKELSNNQDSVDGNEQLNFHAVENFDENETPDRNNVEDPENMNETYVNERSQILESNGSYDESSAIESSEKENLETFSATENEIQIQLDAKIHSSMYIDTIADENSNQTANNKNEMNNMETTHEEKDLPEENDLPLPSITTNGNYTVATNSNEARVKIEKTPEARNSVKEKSD